jgi:hypothetical protein
MISPAARAAKAARNRAAYLKRKDDPAFQTKNRAAAIRHWNANKNSRNEKRNAKNHRLRFQRRSSETSWTRRGFSIVGSDSIAFDRTYWQGPGAAKERRLEKQADKFIAKCRGAAGRATERTP